jgi:hypothetical protein
MRLSQWGVVWFQREERRQKLATTIKAMRARRMRRVTVVRVVRVVRVLCYTYNLR